MAQCVTTASTERRNSHHIAGDLRPGMRQLKNATPAGVLPGSGTCSAALDRLELIDASQLGATPMREAKVRLAAPRSLSSM
ncbi:hypothetical protein GCM10011572_53310 [Pseudoduganella buxea]|uniref:Uncharacterized protein n=1 Tax=Pseudoduganella buxea TaxID=1949069 RepID=A0ABQ1LML5_9BURK|nr:hypothetical protein GCM10011572_53310 [Pseudoduganella buxea]